MESGRISDHVFCKEMFNQIVRIQRKRYFGEMKSVNHQRLSITVLI